MKHIKKIKEYINSITKKQIIVIFIYLVALVIFNIKVDYYQRTIKEFTDETDHVAYIAYVNKNKSLIPKFEEMNELPWLILRNGVKDVVVDEFKSETVNNLGHPPLYYHIMNLFGAVKVEGNTVTYNLKLLRNISQVISNIALILAFYIGYKKLKTVFANFTFAFVLITIPLLAYLSGAVQNDVLSFLGANIFIIGMMNLVDKKRGYLTYFLIAIGACICFLSKLTIALVVIVASIFIIIFLGIREKNLKFIFCKQFLVTLPIYMIVLIYYLVLLSRYGTINPCLAVIAPKYYRETTYYNAYIYRPSYTISKYAKHYWSHFAEYWAGIKLGDDSEKHELYATIPSLLIFAFPIINILYKKIKKKKLDITSIAICLGVFIAIIVQFIKARYEFLYVSGYLGGYFPRYYVCAMVPFILLLANFIDDEMKCKKKLSKGIYIGIVVLYITVLQIETISFK